MPNIAYLDLSHTGTVVDANSISIGIGYVAAYASARFPEDTFRLYKYPDTLGPCFGEALPDIIACSNYMWNLRLHLTVVRAIKQRNPNAIVIFGGPNFPVEPEEQQQFLARHPEIDFYIEGEGEVAFGDLRAALEDYGFDAAAFRRAGAVTGSLRYLADDGRLVAGPMLPRLADLDATLPSPYLTGLLDPFFDDKLSPMIQTTRGCPYSCTFCHDGIPSMSKLRRFSQERIEAELAYAAARTRVPSLTLADLNFGIFPQDVETARAISRLKDVHGWPAAILTATAKNQKDRVVEITRILGDSLHVGASVQSTDAGVLANIKRKNIDREAIVAMALESARAGTTTFSEIILALPGDTKAKHVQSVRDMLDAEIRDLRTFQFILLPGTEGSSASSRRAYGYKTQFRVLPRCFGRYPMPDEAVPVAEYHEVCVGNDTMSHADYLDCRDVDFTVATFNNGGLFNEVYALARQVGVGRSDLVMRVHDLATAPDAPFAALYRQFRDDEARNFWSSEAELEAFLALPDTVDRFLSGEYGRNQIFHFRALALLHHFADMIGMVTRALAEELAARNLLTPVLEDYIDDLRTVLVAQKANLTDLDSERPIMVRFDFPGLAESRFEADPADFMLAGPRRFFARHSAEQRRVLSGFFQQYGTDLAGFSYFLHRHSATKLYRRLEEAEDA